jgi:hypothetical protein
MFHGFNVCFAHIDGVAINHDHADSGQGEVRRRGGSVGSISLLIAIAFKPAQPPETEFFAQ